ncbi:MAG: acetyl-CoA carboxyl transferase [Micromonosporaceae bacterium]|nr:acetyl-CoA carboxyl transferase [Micromonosporaceae bacterium]
MGDRLSARELIDLVLDAGSYDSWDTPPRHPVVSPEYRAALDEAQERTGADESVLTGSGEIRGRRVAVAVCEFGFLAGSIGVAAAERLVAAVERATAERLPLLAATASGGTRMQEGTVAFLQMVKISAAIATHKATGLPYLVYLRNPTTGGVFASWGSLGHVTVAEPGALIGFLGPRVYQHLHGQPFPEGVQRAENLRRRGIVDAVLPPEEIADIADRALRVLCGAPRPGAATGAAGVGELPVAEAVSDVPAWESILRSRAPERPGVRRLLKLAAEDVVPLHGAGDGEGDPGLLLALARFGDSPCVLLGQDRRGQAAGPAEHARVGSAASNGPGGPADRLLGPAALREARRGMRLAAELRIPLVTVIDTPGVALSPEAEEGGLAGQIARCLAELTMLDAPTLCLLLGQGAGGGALSLLPTDRVIAAQHAWLSPLPPEGASAIMYRSTDKAPEMAAQQGVRSLDLRRDGIVDRIIPERPDAAAEPETFCARVGAALESELASLASQPAPVRHAARLARYRRIGRIR